MESQVGLPGVLSAGWNYHRPMAKAYWMNMFRSISDPERVAEYAELAGPVMRKFGGRFLARG
jgi:hypothetical protein